MTENPTRQGVEAKDDKRYEVVNARTGDCYGNHTRAEAVSRARQMHRNWLYRERFYVRERT